MKNSEKICITQELDQVSKDTCTDKYILRLFITGVANRSVLALTTLKKICDEYLEGKYELEVIDLYKKPYLAKEEEIIAAPTLIKKMPLPFRKIIGDMSDEKKILMGLDIRRRN